MEKLKELLDGLVAEKSLSFDVLEQLRKVKTESDELIKVNLDRLEIIKARDTQINQDNSKINELNALVNNWQARDNALIKREQAVLDIEHKNEIEKMKAEHANSTLIQVKEIVGMVFRNTSIKKAITGTENIVQGGGVNSSSYSEPKTLNKLETLTEE